MKDIDSYRELHQKKRQQCTPESDTNLYLLDEPTHNFENRTIHIFVFVLLIDAIISINLKAKACNFRKDNARESVYSIFALLHIIESIIYETYVSNQGGKFI
jgi:hypothetical protein